MPWQSLHRVQSWLQSNLSPIKFLIFPASRLAIDIALFPLMHPTTYDTGCVRWNADADMHVIRHQMPFHYLTFLLLYQLPQYLAKMLSE